MTDRGPGVDYDDSKVINSTKKLFDGSKIQLTVGIPPTGRLFTSEWFHKDRLTGSVLIDWCQQVRDQIDADYFENRRKIDEGRKQSGIRTKDMLAAEDTKVDVDGVVVGVTDPEQFIENMVTSAEKELDITVERLKLAEDAYVIAEDNFKKWKNIEAAVLGCKNAEEKGIDDEG